MNLAAFFLAFEILMMKYFFRFHDKVVIEEELTELRHEQNQAWQTTKYHLKLAKRNSSLFNIEKLANLTTPAKANGQSQIMDVVTLSDDLHLGSDK